MKPPPRELEILLAVAQGKSVGQIARKLGITEQGVKESLRSTRERYGAPNNEAAIAIALDREDLCVGLPERRVQHLEANEIELLDLIAQGYENSVIATKVFLTTSSISKHVSRILHKLGASNRANGVYIASRLGLLVSIREYHVKELRPSEGRALTAIAQIGDLNEVSAMLGLARSTIGAYTKRANRRLGARNTQHAIAIAIRRKEVDCPRRPPNTVRLLGSQELRVLTQMAEGYENRQIAAKLGMKEDSIARMLPAAIRKLGAKSRPQAVYMLFQQGVLR